MILPAFRRRSHAGTIHSLYGAIVAQARSPAFYADYGVPDTVEGRFDLIVLHLVLVLLRLGRENGEANPGLEVGQGLFDVFCRDLDDNLREMGVGDLAVPRSMRQLGEAFYGRQAAYRVALAAADEHELEKALARNIFEASDVDAGATRLARYARAALQLLDVGDDKTLLAGTVLFPDPAAFAHV